MTHRPSDSVPGWHMEAELTSQPLMWARAAAMRAEQRLLPAPGANIAVVGCGTSWFIAQSYAALRERRGLGRTDTFTASELPTDRAYDAVVALTRSGTTTEVLEAVRGVRGRVPVIAIVGDPHSAIADLADDLVALPCADEASVVQTRFATTALALMRASLGESMEGAITDAIRVLEDPLPDVLVNAAQFAFRGAGWTIGLAHEAALKMREAAQCWAESYPAMEYRHGPIAIAAPGRVTWNLGHAPDGLAEQVAATGAHFEDRDLDPMADLVRAHRVALERARLGGLDPDSPRHLTRSVVLSP